MNKYESKSEVARLLRQIEEEYTATQRGLTGLAMVASHASITTRTENIGRCHEALQGLVGKQQATKLLADTLEHL